jgi:HAD superfamily hydrolase (TIGR01509 family)
MPGGALFDVDGTLVDSTYHHTLSWWQAFRRSGRDVVVSRIHRAIGMGAEQLVPHVLQMDVDDDEISSLASAHDAIYATHWPELRVLPGARELLERCHGSGLTTVLASSAGADEVAVVRQLLDADQWLDEYTSSADGDRSKPAPDLVEVALEKGGLAAGSALFVGDAVWDVHACAKAGVSCIGLTCGGTSAAELREAGAIAVYADAAELVAQWDRSPLAELTKR